MGHVWGAGIPAQESPRGMLGRGDRWKLRANGHHPAVSGLKLLRQLRPEQCGCLLDRQRHCRGPANGRMPRWRGGCSVMRTIPRLCASSRGGGNRGGVCSIEDSYCPYYSGLRAGVGRAATITPVAAAAAAAT